MRCILLSFLLIFSFDVYANEKQRKEFYKGIAKSQSGKLLYTEDHEVIFEGGNILRSITRYRNADNKEFAVMDSDYSRSTNMPTYVFRDYSRDYEEGVAYEDSQYLVFFKDKGKDRESTVLKELDAYSCQGWHYFLVNNLDQIEKNQLKLRLILPGKLEAFQFEFVKLDSTSRLLTVKLRVSNWFLNIFAPSLRLVYDKETKRLVKYNGVSNILDAKGKTQDVEITYAYE